MQQQHPIEPLKQHSMFLDSTIWCPKKPLYKWVVLNEKQNNEDSIIDGLIIMATTTGLLFVLKAANIKPPEASLDVIDIIKLAGGTCRVVIVKDYAVYEKWFNE